MAPAGRTTAWPAATVSVRPEAVTSIDPRQRHPGPGGQSRPVAARGRIHVTGTGNASATVQKTRGHPGGFVLNSQPKATVMRGGLPALGGFDVLLQRAGNLVGAAVGRDDPVRIDAGIKC